MRQIREVAKDVSLTVRMNVKCGENIRVAKKSAQTIEI